MSPLPANIPVSRSRRGTRFSLLRQASTAAGIACLAAVPTVASSMPPDDRTSDPGVSEWYEKLKQPTTGKGCCSMADCRPYEARMRRSHWEILIHGAWMPVPGEAVLRVENAVGDAVACLSTNWNYDLPPPHFTIHVLCFVPPPAT